MDIEAARAAIRSSGSYEIDRSHYEALLRRVGVDELTDVVHPGYGFIVAFCGSGLSYDAKLDALGARTEDGVVLAEGQIDFEGDGMSVDDTFTVDLELIGADRKHGTNAFDLVTFEATVKNSSRGEPALTMRFSEAYFRPNVGG